MWWKQVIATAIYFLRKQISNDGDRFYRISRSMNDVKPETDIDAHAYIRSYSHPVFKSCFFKWLSTEWNNSNLLNSFPRCWFVESTYLKNFQIWKTHKVKYIKILSASLQKKNWLIQISLMVFFFLIAKWQELLVIDKGCKSWSCMGH